MNVNAVNSFSINRNDNVKNNSQQSFGSIIPLKVYIDGAPSVSKDNVRRAVRGLSEILFKSSGDDYMKKIIQSGFEKYDRDFKRPDGRGAKSQVLRNKVLNGLSYLFTGGHAQQLDDIGRTIGPAKGRGLDQFGTTKTFEAKARIKEYFDKIEKFITSNSPSKLRERINTETGAYEGKEMGLCIYTSSHGIPNKKGFGLTVNGIAFRKISNEPSVQVSKAEAKTSASAATSASPAAEAKKPRKSSRKKPEIIDWPLKKPATPKTPKAPDELDFGD